MGRLSSRCRSLMRWAYFSIPTFSFLTLAILYAFQFFFSAAQVWPTVYAVVSQYMDGIQLF